MEQNDFMPDLETFMKAKNEQELNHAIETALKYRFPNIKILEIGNENLVIEEGECTKEEVEAFLEEITKPKTDL